jgi:multidrug efflux system outer membrane protein
MFEIRKGVLAVALALSGCSLAPTFEQPKVEMPGAYKQAALTLPADERGSWKPAEPAEAQPRGEWWKVFGDPALDQLVADATKGSPALAAAAARVTQARALLGITSADRGFQASVGVGPINTRSSPASLGLPAGTDVGSRTLWRAPVVASYEVDLFGRVKDSVAAAKKDLAGQEATYRSVELALQADIARTYFEVREADRDIVLLLEAVRIRKASADLLAARLEAGAVGEFDVSRARAELAITQSELEAARGRRDRLESALAVLAGRPPSAVTVDVSVAERKVPAIPAGLPSSLLERRPDVVTAQAALEAANKRIGVAKSAFFPSLRLTGTAGFEADELGDVFRWSSRTWFLGPFIGTILSVPVFDGGRNRAGLERAKAEYEEAVARYRQQVLVAFGDVEDSLAGLRALDAQSRAMGQAVESVRRASRIAQARFDAGAVNYLEVLDVQRTQLDAEREANRVSGARLLGTVALIRALGGGWGEGKPADK